MQLNTSQCFGTVPGVDTFFCSYQQIFCIWKVVLHWHCLKINIHESIHVYLESAVMMKSLQLCTFIHDFYRSVSVFFFFITFWCFACNNFQHIFPPIFHNNYYSYSICFLVRIFYAFNRLTCISLCFGVISRLIFVSFPKRDIFFPTVIMSYLSLILPILITFLVLPNFLSHVIACSYFPPIELI